MNAVQQFFSISNPQGTSKYFEANLHGPMGLEAPIFLVGPPAVRRFERALGVYETMIKEGCHADEKFYAVLARGCVQLHQPLKAHPSRCHGTVLEPLLERKGSQNERGKIW